MRTSSSVRSRGPWIEAFFRRYLRLPSGRGYGEPFAMEVWQRAFTHYFHQVDERGNRVFRLGILGIPRGNGKSPLAAGYGLYETVARRDAPEVYCISASAKLAAIVHNYGRAFVEQGPLQKHGLRPGRTSITYPKGRAFFECLPASGLRVHGRNPATVIADEPHALTTAPERETWVGMWTSLHKRDNPYALMISTAGFDKTTLFGETYDEAIALPLAPVKHSNPCLRIHEDRENGILLWWYGIPEELHGQWDNPELWRRANPASWLHVEDLKKQLAAPGFSALDFQRLHLNMWTTAKEPWLQLGIWEGLGPAVGEPGFLEELPRGLPIWVGVDIGWHDDSSAVVWAARLPDGKIALRAKIWTTRRDQVGEYVPGGTMRLELVEEFIEGLKARHRIKELAFDPTYFGYSAQRLERKRCGKLVEMPPWHPHTVEAWEAFKQLIYEDGISHNGDPALAAHVAAAGMQMTANGPRVKKAASGKIDALAAAVLAVIRCELATRPKSNKSSVFWADPSNLEEGIWTPPTSQADLVASATRKLLAQDRDT